MYRVASFPHQRLVRTCLLAGAFFLPALMPVIAGAVTGPEGGQPTVITGIGHVVDGDTLDVGPTRVRLEGIDAPEIAQTCQTATGESWDCGIAAAAMLRTLAEHKDVACDRTGTDRYRRALATCFADGIDIDEAMVRAGLAWAFVKYSVEYVGVEAEARKEKIGVWQGPSEAPWDFRRNGWQVAEAAAPKGCAIKGNVSAHGRIYHMPWSPWYDKVRMEEGHGKRWFCSEAEALAAGWRPASPN
jgi:endonuclease YncB( thermonuclease family)